MAEMTAAEAISICETCENEKILLSYVWAGRIAALLESQQSQLTQAQATIDTHSELAEHYKQRAEQAEAQNKLMREALDEIRRCVTTCNTPIETVHAMDNIAAAALEGK